MNRITWDEYFMTIAFVVSLRSPDSETRHGTVIISKDHRILSTGYNGFPRGIEPEEQKELPTTRPDKYPYMYHSEVNALSNLFDKQQDMTAYITGEPCDSCLMSLWQNGITTIKFDSKYKCRKNAENYTADDDFKKIFRKKTGIVYIPMSIDFSFINERTFQCSNLPLDGQ